MPRRVWIVWLMLALLPLRGWAAVSMAMPDVAAAVAHAGHTDETTAASAPPCHGADAEEAGTTGHACTLCDLCHGAVADLAAPLLAAVPLPGAMPPPATPRDTGRHAVGGLERPPRLLLG